MQETDFVLKAGDYRKVILSLSKEKKLRRAGQGPITNDTVFKIV